MSKGISVGIEDFKELISKKYYFVDKSLFIKDILKSGAKATLIPRPRRFGKTINMSMLKYFFEKTVESCAFLFNDLAISEHNEIMEHQGQYPVIFFTLKLTGDKTWDDSFEKLKRVISDVYSEHIYLLNSQILNSTQKEIFNDIISLKAKKVDYEASLKKLTEYLSNYHNTNPILLIDEYDVPVHSGFINGYYSDVVAFTKNLLGDVIKSNKYLGFAVLTGALRVTKESIFTDMNNFVVCSMLNDRYADKFGLTEEEVTELLNYYKINVSMNEVRSWYNGYSSGSLTVYNPWSIINLAWNNGNLQSYWLNTSSDNIVKNIIKDKYYEYREDLEKLITRSSITKAIKENISYPDIKSDETTLWSFLFFTGYLTFRNLKFDRVEGNVADLFIPNDEVSLFFKQTIRSCFTKGSSITTLNQIVQTLLEGDIKKFSNLFTNFVLSCFSFYDITENEPERFYHAFVLGMIASISEYYEIKSNRESGFGRYDIAIIPRDKSKLALVIEFKKVDVSKKETIEDSAENAIKQIKEKGYATDLFSHGIRSVLAVGIAFEGKKVFVCSELLI